MRYLIILLVTLSIYAAGPVRIAFDSKVVDWNYRCKTNDYSSQGIPNFTHSLIASSIWIGGYRNLGLYPGNILRANLFCGRSYGGTYGCGNDGSSIINIGNPQVPLINDQGGSLDVSGQFQNSWFYQETGTGGGLGAHSGITQVYLNTGLAPNNISSWLNDAHVSVYMESGGVEASVPIGVHGGTDYLQITTSYTGLGQITVIGGSTGYPVNADTVGTGLYLGTRTSSAATGTQQYKNGVATGTSSSVGGSLGITNSIYIFAQNDVPVNGYTVHLIGGYAIGRGITVNQATNCYNIWQQYETLLSRQK